MTTLIVPKPSEKLVVVSKQFHSSLSSLSIPGDVFLNFYAKKGQIDFPLKEGKTIVSVRFPQLNGEVIDNINETPYHMMIYVEADETFYRDRTLWQSASKEEMNKLVRLWLCRGGWTKKQKPILKRIHQYEKEVETEKRKKAGYVLPSYEGKRPAADFQGGLSDQLFNHPYVQRYVKGGNPFGYLGSFNRTFAIDRAFEALLRKDGEDNAAIAVFLCHSAGRHFMYEIEKPSDIGKHIYGYWPTGDAFDKDVKEAGALEAK